MDGYSWEQVLPMNTYFLITTATLVAYRGQFRFERFPAMLRKDSRGMLESYGLDENSITGKANLLF